MIAEALAGRRIAITGSTGFVGTALVERILREVPDAEIVLLVRHGRRSTAARRVERELLRNDAFDRLRGELGPKGFDEMVARRVKVVAGDVSADGLGLSPEDRELWASCQTIIHSAATVAFDAPLDGAVEINLLGPSRIAALANELGVTPHLVAVSTCYVAGNRKGRAPEQLVSEGPFDLDLDWRAEVAAARRVRADAEAASRSPEQLQRLRNEARAELGAAGAPALAAKTEQLRERWVQRQLVEAGRARAASLGWPDAYAYTKALGELALTETKGAVPVSIVRPSIIESAWAEPRPGWIRGFRMAEPVIISYARGLLKQFPGPPEGVIDVIPVDLVVAAILAVAAAGPDAAAPITQVASGSTNPLVYRTLVDVGRSWFLDHPLYDTAGQPIVPPEFAYPSRGQVERQLTQASRLLRGAEKVARTLPLRGKQAAWAAALEERSTEVQRALEYVELYGLYAECEALYGVDHLLELWDRLPPEDHERFLFDPRAIDWRRYITEIHLPSIVRHARVKTTPGQTKVDRAARLRKAVLAPERHLAAFDLENTLIASNVVASYAWLASRRLPPADRARLAGQLLAEAPRLWSIDRRDRSDFLRYFYRRYRDAPAELLAEDATEMLHSLILTKSFPAGLRRVREHRAAGHRTVLITGALDFIVEPLRPLFDEILAAEMTMASPGRYSGELAAVPPTGESRAQLLMDYCDAEGLQLEESSAYADSSSDLAMLEAVGFPVAVNPEAKLAAIARKRGWLVEQWDKPPGGVAPVVPLAPPWPERSRTVRT